MKMKIHSLWYPGGLAGAAAFHPIAHGARQINGAERDDDDMYPNCGAPASPCKVEMQRGSVPTDLRAGRKDETIAPLRQGARRNRILDALPAPERSADAVQRVARPSMGSRVSATATM